MTQKVDTLLTNAIVLTMDGKLNHYDPGAVAVKGDQIIAVGAESEITKEYIADETIACDGKVLMPGLINAHTHARPRGRSASRCVVNGLHASCGTRIRHT
jgi:5-methylthioadenosine/S-adenosylhomocysteine deaminase